MTASPDIWMPIYIGDYLADTMHLSLEEHGAYFLTIMHYWKNGGSISKNHIKNICHCNGELIEVVSSFFTEKDGMLCHTRIDFELLIAKQKCDNNNKKTKAASAARWKKLSVTDSVTECSTDTPSPSPSPSPSPPSLPSQTPEEGVLEDFKGKRKYDVNLYLNDTGRAYAKLHAPDWDMYYLIRIYNEGIASGKRTPPDNANAAFPAWCKNYTKGKVP